MRGGRRLRLAAHALGLAALTLSCATTEEGEALRTLQVSVRTPNPCWSVHIEEVYASAERIYVLSRLEAPPEDRLCIQVLGTATDRVEIRAPDLPVRHLVLGRTWGFRGDESAQGAEMSFPDGREAAMAEIRGEKIYTADEEGDPEV